MSGLRPHQRNCTQLFVSPLEIGNQTHLSSALVWIRACMASFKNHIVIHAGKRKTEVRDYDPTFDGIRTIVVLSVAATGIFLLTTTLVMGIICGCWLCHTNQDKDSSGKASDDRSQQQIADESCPRAAVHEQVCIGGCDQEHLQAVDLADNIAYVSTQEITKTKDKLGYVQNLPTY